MPTAKPLYHFAPEEHFMNDPNGLVWHEGYYHLFYQLVINGQQHWGHASSKDLVRWENRPPAITPDKLGNVWSGSAVSLPAPTDNVARGQVIAFFTSQNELLPPNGPQVQCLATSVDGGETFARFESNPVVPNSGDPDFRDPKVFWHEPTGAWVMVLACSSELRFFRSLDMINWTRSGTLKNPYQGTWECPDLFKIGVEGTRESRWILIVSTVGGETQPDFSFTVGTEYYIGSFDGYSFVADPMTRPGRLDYGPDNYAAITWNNLAPGDDRRIAIGWMSTWLYAFDVPLDGWKGMMTIPRELRLMQTSKGLRLAQFPVRELESISGAPIVVPPSGDNSFSTALPHHACRIKVALHCTAESAAGIKLTGDSGCEVAVGYDGPGRKLYIDRSQSGAAGLPPDFNVVITAPYDAGETACTLDILLDRWSIEVFTGDGLVAVTAQIFPGAPLTRLTTFAGEASIVNRIEAQGMEDVYSADRAASV